MLVEIDDEMAIEMLVERVEFWTSDYKVINLFRKMYESYVYNGCFESGEFNTMTIVDNDYINYTTVIYDSDDEFEEILKIYKEQGLGDCSCQCDYGFIESCDDDEQPTMFLVRL